MLAQDVAALRRRVPAGGELSRQSAQRQGMREAPIVTLALFALAMTESIVSY